MTAVHERGATDVEQTTKPARVKVGHLYWTSELAVACELGLAVISLCGSATQKAFVPSSTVDVIGGLMPVAKPRDCKRCLAVLESHARKVWGQNHR